MPSKTTSSQTHYPPFNLERLLTTVFDPKRGEKLCILIDLDNPRDVIDFAFTKKPQYEVQKKAYEIFYQEIHKKLIKKYGLTACDFYAYKTTKGSNLEIEDKAVSADGRVVSLQKDVYPVYDLILCISNFSATAPLTASAKTYGFRGATMHGLNDIILQSGLAVDYNEVSRFTEKLRKGMTHAESADIDFEVEGKNYHLHIDLGKQDAQKSHGICKESPDVANLPAGEVYFVPYDADGQFPMKFEDGTIGLMEVKKGRIDKITLLKGDSKVINDLQYKFDTDPAAGMLGELGFGTQTLPFANADIQDEKIFGTFHLATGRNDHLNGSILLKSFANPSNATHDDILFSLTKNPEIHIKQVRLNREGKSRVIIENNKPTEYLVKLRDGP